MSELPSFNYVRKVLTYEPDSGLFVWRRDMKKRQVKAGDIAGHLNAKLGYVMIGFNGRPVYAHRLALFYQTGVWPTATVDHINGVRSDNRLCNLREASRLENANGFRAISKANTSGYTGVVFHKQRNRWHARTILFGKSVSLGLHDTLEEAAKAVKKERARHGFN